MTHGLMPAVILMSLVAYVAIDSAREKRSVGSARADRFAFCGACLLALYTVIIAATRRPEGDSGRYLDRFIALRDYSISDAIALADSDYLFVVVLWGLGRIGDSPALLFGSIAGLMAATVCFVAGRLFNGRTAACLILGYLAYPYFIPYLTSGLRQGMGMALFFLGLYHMNARRRRAWVMLAASAAVHVGLTLAVAAVIMRSCTLIVIRRDTLRWKLLLTALGTSIAFSVTEISLGSLIPLEADGLGRQGFYLSGEFSGPAPRSGFRLDYLLLSLLPFAALRWSQESWSPPNFNTRAGFWLSSYVSVNVIYHIFAYAPFSDRFGALSWYFLPLVVFVIAVDLGGEAREAVLGRIALIGAVCALQFYTGSFIQDSPLLF